MLVLDVTIKLQTAIFPSLAVGFQEVVHPVGTEDVGVARLQRSRSDRMNIHQNARLTPSGRERLVRLARSGLALRAVAATMSGCLKIVRKWVARYEAEGAAGLQYRSSRHHTLHRPTPAETQAAVVALRRQRLTGAQIARDLALSPATVSPVLRLHGLNRLRDLEPPEPVRRYERARPGELIQNLPVC